jgi:hypothetical protein
VSEPQQYTIDILSPHAVLFPTALFEKPELEIEGTAELLLATLTMSELLVVFPVPSVPLELSPVQ